MTDKPPGGYDVESFSKTDHQFEATECDFTAKRSSMAENLPVKSAAEDFSVHASRTLLAVLVLSVSLGSLAMSSLVPAIPTIQLYFDVSSAVAQLTLSISMWSMAVCSLIYGALADRFGRRTMLLSGVGLAIVGSLICALAPSIDWVIVGRTLQAAGATAGFVLARVIVRDVYGDDRAASVIGYITAAVTLAPMIGPILGGYLIETAGWRSVFVAMVGIATFLWLLTVTQLPETRPAGCVAAGPLFDLRVFATLLKISQYRGYVLFGVMTHSTIIAFLAGAPYVVTHYFGSPATAYGLYFIVVPAGYVVGSFIAGRYGETIGHRRLLYMGSAGSLITGLVSLWLSSAPGFTPWGLFLPMAVVAACQGMAMPAAQVAIMVAAGERSAAASGLFGFLQLVFSGLVAQLVGTIIGWGPVVVTGAITLAAALACVPLLLTKWPLDS